MMPRVVTVLDEARSQEGYDNHPVASVNDQVVRISTMTEPYFWHHHPDSDEVFLVVEGRLRIELEEGVLELGPGQMTTIPRGVRHRTLPVGGRSVNLTVEARDARTVPG